MGSSSYPHHHDYQQNQEELHLPSDLPQHHHHTPPSIHRRQLLLACAHSISNSDFTTAHRIATVLSTTSSPSGDSSERLTYSFTKALSLRLPPPLSLTTFTNINNPSSTNDTLLQSSYITLNQITPFIRFTHLTANQSILEAINQSHHNNIIHILDFDIMHGVQWPPLMQAISDHHPPLTLRITAVGTDLHILRTTGDRLSKFSYSLGLSFSFFALLIPHNNVDDVINHLSSINILPNETLAVNCVLYLHRLLTDRDELIRLLKKIKSMNPKVVTLGEKEANHNNPLFISRFNEALSYYTAVFESLEVTLPPNSRERMTVEQVWFGREIEDIVMEERERRERHERFVSWEMMMKVAGFRNVVLSPFAVSQAKLLLRLHYPCEGYNLEVVNDCLFLGWNNQPLFCVSSWH